MTRKSLLCDLLVSATGLDSTSLKKGGKLREYIMGAIPITIHVYAPRPGNFSIRTDWLRGYLKDVLRVGP
jgi:hypothetical protein